MRPRAPRKRHARTVALVLACLACLTGCVGGCTNLQSAARKDPLKCERDPKCDGKRGRTADCSMQCSDDPACVERCEQVQAPNGRLGR